MNSKGTDHYAQSQLGQKPDLAQLVAIISRLGKQQEAQ